MVVKPSDAGVNHQRKQPCIGAGRIATTPGLVGGPPQGHLTGRLLKDVGYTPLAGWRMLEWNLKG